MNLTAELRLQAIINGTRAGTWEWNVRTGEAIRNERWATMLGFTLEEIGPASIKTWNRLCHPDDLERSDQLISQHLEGKRPFYDCLCRVRRKDGSWCWIRDRGMLVREADGTPTDWIMGTHIDVSVEQESQQHLADLAASVPGVLFSFEVPSPDSVRFTYVSERSYAYFGLDCEAIEADPSVFLNAVHPADLAEVQATLLRCYDSVREESCQFRMVVNGSKPWFRAVARPIQSLHGKLIWHGMLINMDDQKQLENKLAQLSVTDELTGLFNRRYMTEILGESIELYRRYQRPCSLLSLDIDHFKQVNDTYGHLVGDKVLAKIGELMEGHLRTTDVVGRMGGEEFLILFPHTSGEKARQVAEFLRQTISQTEFLSEDDTPFRITISGGILEIAEDMASVEDLMNRTDRLLYEAKESGRNMVLA